MIQYTGYTLFNHLIILVGLSITFRFFFIYILLIILFDSIHTIMGIWSLDTIMYYRYIGIK